MNRTILITGATSGIGRACAEAFAAQGDRLILTGRRKDRLEALAAQLPAETCILHFDVRDREATAAAIASLEGKWRDIDILINNAGLAVGLHPIHSGEIEDWERMIDTNVKGMLYVSREVTPMMVQRGHGHIINIGSIAGKEVYPNGNVYCASKHAAHALSQGMRMDLLHHGIKVSHVAPGLVETEFSIVRFKGDEERAKTVYEGLNPLTGEDIANIVTFLANLPAHVNINDIVVMPTAQASSTLVKRG